ncbi:hypothetical protein U1Q18_007747 [Sarracenia purpurea var. burkii]
MVAGGLPSRNHGKFAIPKLEQQSSGCRDQTRVRTRVYKYQWIVIDGRGDWVPVGGRAEVKPLSRLGVTVVTMSLSLDRA